MPFIRITTFGKTLTAEQVNRLQQGTTELMVTVMRKPIEGTAVLVEQIDRGGWSIAGKSVEVAAQVEATIGSSTNTSDEKAHFMADMMKLLRSVLGKELRDETYITFHQFDHDSYGRGGITRSQREARRKVA
jgi:phenylpyruvate tautomerase PptA (4-oxalocrotonate tautomerase family)